MKRRDFLASAATLAVMPRLAFAANGVAPGRVVVLLELKGGNDGLNTVVPYADPLYARLRPRLALRREDLLALTEREALHPSLAALLPMWQASELAVVQGVGYPKPNLSHFRSIEIWDTASASDQYLGEGWVARTLAAYPVPPAFAADGAVIGGQELGPLAGARALALQDPQRFVQQARLAAAAAARGPAALAHVLRVEADVVQAASRLSGTLPMLPGAFPAGELGHALQVAASVIAGPAPVAAVKVTLNGFDTHQAQAGVQANLLRQLAEGLAAFRSALVEAGRWDDTLVLTYAEFGRRPAENGSMGTDHGTSNVHFLAGGRVKGGLHGARPRLDALEGDNLPFAVDFRSLYATVLERWWGVDAVGPLRGRFAPLDLVRA